MVKQKEFSQQEIENLLTQLGINFQTTGLVQGRLQYASLRDPQCAGIYYLTAGITEPESISGSIILTDNSSIPKSSKNTYIQLNNPQLAFYKLMRSSYPVLNNPGIHPTAIIDKDALISEHAYVGPYCIVEASTEIGANCRLESHIIIKSNSRIGSGTHIESHCTIGATGVVWTLDDDGNRVIQPQTGSVVIGASVFIGSDVSIVRGSVNEPTVIGNGTVIAHGSKIGHGCRIGEHVHLANNISLAGNVDVGNRAFLGSGAVVRPQVVIADRVVVGAGSVVVHNIEEPGSVVGGVPAKALKRTSNKLAGVPYSAIN